LALFNSDKPSFAAFRSFEAKMQNLLRCSSLNLSLDQKVLSIVVMLAVVVSGLYLFLKRLVIALESPEFYLLFGVSFIIAYLSIAFNVLRLFSVWQKLGDILKALERRPFRAAFTRFHKTFPELPHINITSAPQPLTALHLALEQASELVCCAKRFPDPKPPLVEKISDTYEEVKQSREFFDHATRPNAANSPCATTIALLKAQRSLAQASCEIESALDEYWRTCPEPDLKRTDGAKPVIRDLAVRDLTVGELTVGGLMVADSATRNPATRDSSLRDLADKSEVFLVARTVLFFSHVFPQLRNLAFFSLISLMLMLVAVSSYPFQPHQLIVMFNWIIIFCFVGVGLYVSVEMNRNALLSNLNGTKPGQLSWDRDFVTRILLYVVIPILGFLGVQFPEVIGQFFSLLSPGAAGH
jgi:hypothetical protein